MSCQVGAPADRACFDAVLFASYGTSRDDARAASIDCVAEALRRGLNVPSDAFFEAYTSAKARRVLARRGTPVADVSEALHQMARAGYRRVLVQPGHLLYGDAFAQVQRAVAECRFFFEGIELGAPLFAEDADVAKVASALDAAYPAQAGEALVLVGHGAETAYAGAGSVYTSLFLHLRLLGRTDAFVGSMHEFPQVNDVRVLLRSARDEQGEPFARVRLVPLMLTAAAHAARDIAGDRPSSWASALAADGFEVRADLVGLGSLPAIRELYVAHARAALEGMSRRPGRNAETVSGVAQEASSPARGALPATQAAPGAAQEPAPASQDIAPATQEPAFATQEPAFATQDAAPASLDIAPATQEPENRPRFPLFITLCGKTCVVAGIGTVGSRRARTLARFGARVIAIDPAPRAADVVALKARGVVVRERAWIPSDIDGADLVVAATNDRAMNASIAAACAARGIPVSVADDADASTFFFPALAMGAHAVAGIVSDGSDHRLTARVAARVREVIEEVDGHGGTG